MSSKSVEIMNVVEFIARKFIQERICFVFAGSVISLIQGCEITPGDIDILVPKSADVHKVVLILSEFLIEEPLDVETSIENWIATHSSPIKRFTDFVSNEWTFSRLIVNGIKLEITNIQPVNEKEYTDGSGFWENGPHVWQHTIMISLKDIELPVIPLEIQLETNMNRNLETRINEIIKIFRNQGYNEKLINLALNKVNRMRFHEILSAY